SPLERSGSGLLPASPPDAPGVPTPVPPPVAPAPPVDDVWEDAWPRPVEREEQSSPLPDSLSWGQDVPPPVVRTRHRGTLHPGVERPHMPLSPQQKLLLLDTWQRSGLPARDFAALV